MNFVLDLLYALGLLLISPFWLYRMLRHGRYRRGLAGRFGFGPSLPDDRPVIWLHAVSLGEINGIRTLAARLEEALGDRATLAISTTTDTGMNQALKLYGERHVVFQFPFDFTLAITRTFRRIHPSVIVLMEGEIWPNLLRAANRRSTPVVLVNGRMSENRGYPRYKKVSWLVRRMFNRLTVLAVQDELYAHRFIDVGTRPDKVRVTGMMKYDTVETAESVAGCEALAAAVGLDAGQRLIVAGGTGVDEEAILLEVYARLRRRLGDAGADLRLAIVPRKPERFEEVARLIAERGFSLVRRSASPDGVAVPVGDADTVILGDTMGELRAFYALSSCIFVGRSLVPQGGSDMIEAAALGKPTAFGPHAFNFPQAAEMAAEGAAAQVADAEALETLLADWLSDPAAAADLGRRGRQFVVGRQGATERNLEIILDLLNGGDARAQAAAAGAARDAVETDHA